VIPPLHQSIDLLEHCLDYSRFLFRKQVALIGSTTDIHCLRAKLDNAQKPTEAIPLLKQIFQTLVKGLQEINRSVIYVHIQHVSFEELFAVDFPKLLFTHPPFEFFVLKVLDVFDNS